MEATKSLLDKDIPVMRLDPMPCSNLAYGFNLGLCYALNMKRNGEATHFAMLHSDIEPSPWWLDVLWEEMDRTGAHWISAASPIKDGNGLTSTAIGKGDNRWNVWARITMHELFELPETFCIDDLGENADDLGYELLLNTGCMLIDLRHEYWDEVGDGAELPLSFDIRNRIIFNPLKGWEAQTESEDWRLSRHLNALGAKLFCTRKVGVKHWGSVPFASTHPWGNWTQDQAGDRAIEQAAIEVAKRQAAASEPDQAAAEPEVSAPD